MGLELKQIFTVARELCPIKDGRSKHDEMNPEKYFLGFPTSTHASSLGYKKAEEANLQQSCVLNSSTIQRGNWKRQSLRHEGFYFWCPRIPWDHYCSCWGDVSLIKKHIIDHHYIEWGSSCYLTPFSKCPGVGSQSSLVVRFNYWGTNQIGTAIIKLKSIKF